MRTYTQLTYEQRYQIYALMKAGHTQKTIASIVETSPSTICREIKRNKGLRGYRPKQAQRLYTKHRMNSYRPMKLTSEMKSTINTWLVEGWSPEQIHGRLNAQGQRIVSHEWIYQYIWKDKHNGGGLYKHLRHGHKRYRKRYGSYDNRGQIKNRVSIDQRPSIIDDRQRMGDWEIDTVIGRHHQKALVTIVERYTRLTLIELVSRKTAQAVSKATTKLLKPFQSHTLSITADNGLEFADHHNISKNLSTKFYFAHPYHSWERGLNENTNGLIRQYLPKGSSFNCVDNKQIQSIQDKLNNRPRKCLGFKTPNEVFFKKEVKNAA